MGRRLALLVVIVGFTGYVATSSWAQSAASLGETAPWLNAPGASPPGTDDDLSGWPRFRRSLSFGLLGATIGGGIGAAMGTVHLHALDRDRRDRYRRDERGGVPAAPLGIWIGGVVGAAAGGRAPIGEETLILTMSASVLTGVFTTAAAAAASNGHPVWTAIGWGVGASAGAALAVMARPVVDSQGLVHLQKGSVSLSVPAIRVRPDPLTSDRVMQSVVLLSARF